MKNDKDFKRAILLLQELASSGTLKREQTEMLTRAMKGLRKAYRSGEQRAMAEAIALAVQAIVRAHSP